MPGFNYGGKGDGTNWSSERGDGPQPGGGDRGHAGDHDRHHGGSGGSGGNWAGKGPLNAELINNAISEALKKQIPRNTVAATSTPAYRKMGRVLGRGVNSEGRVLGRGVNSEGW